MDIVQENIDALNAIVKIKVSPDDYQEKYEDSLKDYRKRANIPGFRNGKVPMGIVKKRFGKSVLAEEVNRILVDSLTNYLKEKELDVLGQPMPKMDEETEYTWEENEEFEFSYEIGLAPEFEVKLSDKDKFDYFTVKVDDELIDKQVTDLTKRYGKLTEGEVSEDNDMILGAFAQLDDEGNEIEGGIRHTSTVSIENVTDEKVKASLIGLKGGDAVVVDPKTVSQSDADMAAMLGVSPEAVPAITSKFNFTVNEVKRVLPAEINQELFDKLFGAGEVSSEDEFRAKIQDDLTGMFVNDSDRIFQRDVSEKLMEILSLPLPDAFLKRWIVESNADGETPVSLEQVEADYEGHSKGLQWQLIKNKIIGDNDLKVEQEEVVNYIKGLLGRQYAQYGLPEPEEEQLNQNAMQVLQNREEAERAYNTLYDSKILTYFKDTVKLNSKEVSYDDFLEVAKGNHQH